MATDTARTTEKSYWRKSREGETKQVKFKTLFKYSQQDVTSERFRTVTSFVIS